MDFLTLVPFPNWAGMQKEEVMAAIEGATVLQNEALRLHAEINGEGRAQREEDGDGARNLIADGGGLSRLKQSAQEDM